MVRKNRRLKLSALAVIAAAASPVVKAQTSDWTGTAGDNLWATPTNWDNGVPGSGFIADFNGTQAITGTTISLGNGTQAIGTILFDSTGGSPGAFTLGNVGSGDAFVLDAGGAITVNSGVANAQIIGAVVQTNGSLNVTNAGTGGLTLNGIVVNNGGTLTINDSVNNATTTLAGAISDAGGVGSLALVGNNNTNIFAINGANTYSGNTTITFATSGGSIQLGNDSAFSTGKVSLTLTAGNAPSITATNTRTLVNAFDLNSGITFTGTNAITFTGPINVINNTAGGSNGRTLNASVAGQIMTFGSAASPSTITVGNPVANGGDGTGKTLTLNAVSGAMIVVNDAIQDPSTGGGTASATVAPTGSGTIRFMGQSTYSGLANLAGGGTIIQVGSSTIMSGSNVVSGPLGAGTITFNNGTNSPLQPYGADQSIGNPINMITGFTVQNAPTSGVNADLAGAHNLNLTGNFLLSSTSGRTVTIQTVGKTVSIGNTSGTSIFTLNPSTTAVTDPFAVFIGATLSMNAVMVDNPLATLAPTVNYTNSGSNGMGTVIINAASTYSGQTTFTNSATNTGGSGVIEINVNTATSGTSIVSGPFGVGTVVFNTANGNTPTIIEPINADRVIANPITLSAGFFANDPGVARSLTFTGPITMTVGKTFTDNLIAGASENWGSAGASSTLTLTGQATLQSQQNPGSQFIINDLVQDGSSKGSILTQSLVNLTLTNPNNTFTGGVTINGGTVVNISSNGNLGAGTAGVTLANAGIGGTLLSTGTFTAPVRPLSLNGTGTAVVDVTGTNVVTWNGVVSGANAGGLIKGTNTGTFILGGTNNTYVGGTKINGGSLGAVSDASLGTSGTSVTINAGGTFLGAGNFTTSRQVNFNDAATSTIDALAGNTMVLNGTISATGAINKGPLTGTVQFAQNGYTAPGNVNVLGGTLAFGDPVSGVTGPVNIPGTLSVSDGATASFIPATGTAITHTINTLNLNTAGKLDVGNSSFLTNSNVQPYLAAGYNNGAWNGSGAAIISTSANTAPGTAARSLGFASDADQAAGRVAAGNPTLAAGQTLVKYTTPGDADLSGKSDFNDFLAMQNNFNKAGNWTQGDFDYNGTTNFNDFLILQNNFNRGLNANGTTAGGTVAHSAVSKLTASPAAVTPSVTYILSKNDDGKGNLTPGKYAVYAVDSSADGNQGVASFSVDVQGASLVTNFAPQGTFDKGQGNGSTVVEGFTLLRSVSGAFSTGTDPVKGSQDTVDDQSGVVLIYGMGQVAGNLNTKAPSGSTGGSGKVQASYGSPLLISTGTFASGLAFNSDQTFDKANVFLTNTAADTEAAGISLVTQDLSVGVPEPTTLGVIALGAGSLLARRKRRK